VPSSNQIDIPIIVRMRYLLSIFVRKPKRKWGNLDSLMGAAFSFKNFTVQGFPINSNTWRFALLVPRDLLGHI
jgi:hypothetical protein